MSTGHKTGYISVSIRDSIVDYTAAFHARLLECSDVSDAEVVDRYVCGLKPTTRDWVLIRNPMSMH